MANPSVSVIVPVYNVERYVKFCVDSILNQTFQDFEIILVDDASPDNCWELCQKFYGDNDKVKFFRHEKNLGLGSARNTGMKNALGKYVYFVDSDDYILPNALEKLYETAEKNNAQVVHAGGWYGLEQEEVSPIYEQNLSFRHESYSEEGFLPTDLIQRLEVTWRRNAIFPTAWLCFCRLDFVRENNLEFLPIISEDDTFNFALLCTAERYYILHEAFYVYRIRSGSIMTSKTLNKFSKGIKAMIAGSIYIGKFFEQFPRFDGYEQWREDILTTFFMNYQGNHTRFFYDDLEISPQINAEIEKTLTPFFGDKEPFVKFFFDNFHIFRRQAEILFQQRENLLYQNQQLRNIMATFVREQPALLKLMNEIKTDGKKIFLMSTPRHGNLGDHAIVLGELKILREYFPEHKIIEIPTEYLSGELGELLSGLGFEKYVRPNDIICWHGGGNLGNLWVIEEILRRQAVEKFPENKFIIFPQSICFTADDEGRRELALSQKVYNAHSDLHLMTRDENSFEFAKKFFPRINNYLLPDAATVLHGIFDDLDDERKGVLFVLRSDKEKVRDDGIIKSMQEAFTADDIPFEVIDTVINERVTADNREQKVREVMLKIRRSKLVVTDRFHGVIFSFITRTPVLAFKSFDTKISSGIRWFRNLPSIFYAEAQNSSSIENFVNEYYNVAAEEKISSALNCKVETDSRKRFFNALDKIATTNKIYPINSTPPPAQLRRLPKSRAA